MVAVARAVLRAIRPRHRFASIGGWIPTHRLRPPPGDGWRSFFAHHPLPRCGPPSPAGDNPYKPSDRPRPVEIRFVRGLTFACSTTTIDMDVCGTVETSPKPPSFLGMIIPIAL